MIVWVDDRLFADATCDVDRLALLRNAALRRHTLIVSAAADDHFASRQAPNFDAWLDALPDRLRAEVDMLLERVCLVSANTTVRGTTRLLVCAQDPGASHNSCWLTLTDAVRAIAQPLQLMVENQINDAEFIRCAMPPEWRRRLEKWERNGELRFVNGGGVSVMKTLVKYHREGQNARLAFGLPFEIWRLVHFILYDHDGAEPDFPGEQSRLLEGECNQAGMDDRSHRLRRKDQEHYLPLEALKRIVSVRVTNIEQRDRLLEKIDHHAMMSDQRHFSQLPSNGETPFFKNEFTRNDTSDWDDSWFEKDGAWPEMTQLAERIASAI